MEFFANIIYSIPAAAFLYFLLVSRITRLETKMDLLIDDKIKKGNEK